MIFLDTNVAIALRDVDRPTVERMRALEVRPVISVVTRIELESGVNRSSDDDQTRRQALNRMLNTLPVEFFTENDILTYGRIVRDLGYDRRATLDRLIAAQAITRDAPLITRNGRDFRRIDGLKLVEW